MNKILEVKNLRKIYHTKKDEILAVDDFSFDLYKGEFVSIVGPSGCGKSTILSILCNLIDHSDGKIKFNNDSKIGYMLQDDSLFDFRNILSNCLIGLEINKNLNQENKEYVEKLLKDYGLYEFKDKYPDNLSGGMRQRVV
ncbi:MAG: ATP-binding cassette domain-containing protein [Bacilli bacterium]|nr:ATP-binding cassette domain-containing protein [Bacilli bacterium]